MKMRSCMVGGLLLATSGLAAAQWVFLARQAIGRVEQMQQSSQQAAGGVGASYDVATVIVDVPASWLAWKREILARSDRIFLTMELTVVATREARRQLDLIRAEELHGVPLSILANRVRARATGSLAIAEAERREPRREIVPLRQSVAVFGKLPSIFDR